MSNFQRRRPKLRNSWKEKDTSYKVGRARVLQAKKEPPRREVEEAMRNAD